MKYSEAMRDKTLSEVFGVDVDGFFRETPTHLSVIGIQLKLEDDGEIDLNTMDTIIALTGKGVSVIAEVPFSLTMESKKLFYYLNSLGATISLLPPNDLSEESVSKYINKLNEFTELWLTSKNAKVQLLPVSGFFQYMVSREFKYLPESITEDDYINDVFVKPFSGQIMDDIKSELEATIIRLGGGKQAFQSYCHSFAAAIGEI